MIHPIEVLGRVDVYAVVANHNSLVDPCWPRRVPPPLRWRGRRAQRYSMCSTWDKNCTDKKVPNSP